MEEKAQNERLEAEKKAKDGKQKERLKREVVVEEEGGRRPLLLLQEAEERKAARKKKEYFVRVLAEDAKPVAPGDTAKDVADDGRFGPPPDGFVWSVLF